MYTHHRILASAIVGTALVVVPALLASPALAQTPARDQEQREQVQEQDQPRPEPSASPRLRIEKCSELVGKTVKNNEEARLGEVEDLAIDPEQGRIVYAVLSFGGFLGLGEKWFAIPINAMSFPTSKDSFVFAVEKEQLKKASGFDKSNWPNMGDPRWASETHSLYAQPPYWTEEERETRPMRIQRATDLMGRKVVNAQGESLGEVHDLAIDPDRRAIAYAVLSFGSTLGMGEKWFAIPWSSFKVPADESEQLTLEVDKQKLQIGRGFDKDRWPDMADMTWAKDTHSQYGARPYWENFCAACGLPRTAWKGGGESSDRQGYCCSGCAMGTGCTCRK